MDRRFLRDRRASVSVMFALALIPLMIGIGMGIDYAAAAQKHTRLNAVADAAALVAVTPAMMAQSTSAAQLAATNVFNGQIAQMQGLTLNPSGLVVSVVDTTTATGVSRAVSVKYSAESANFFSGILGVQNIDLVGTAQSASTNSPNVDFHMLLDSSPSMAIAATTSGIATMVANTSSQGGCAFACHQANPALDNLGNPNGWDNYALARNLGVVLRFDLVTQATANLMDTAIATQANNNAKYRVALYDFDYTFKVIAPITSNLAGAKVSAKNIQMLQVDHNNCLTAVLCNSDEDTDWDTALATINLAMPPPGNGTNNFGDTPQEVLFIVTDGVSDELYMGGRKIAAMGGTLCSTVKLRNIRIAILYTTYNPLPTNGFYNSNIAPFQANIGPTLQACASPGLFFQVDTGGDISSAMNILFQKALGAARLTQ